MIVVVVVMVKVVTVNMMVMTVMVMVVIAMMVVVMVIIVHHAFFPSLIPACLFFLLSFSSMCTYLPYRAQLSEPLWRFD